MTETIPYKRNLVHTSQEIGPIVPSDLLSLVERAPEFMGTMSFRMNFVPKARSRSSTPGSVADLVIDRENGALCLENIYVPDTSSLTQFRDVLRGIRLGRLNLRHPRLKGTKEDFSFGGESFEVLRRGMQTSLDRYELDVGSFNIGYHIVKVPEEYPGFFQSSYSARVLVRTDEMVKGKPERKLVLKFTPELADSDEVRAYKHFFDTHGK